MGVEPKIGGFYPQIIHFNRVFHYKPSILRYPYFWKHPYLISLSIIFYEMNMIRRIVYVESDSYCQVILQHDKVPFF